MDKVCKDQDLVSTCTESKSKGFHLLYFYALVSQSVDVMLIQWFMLIASFKEIYCHFAFITESQKSYLG